MSASIAGLLPIFAQESVFALLSTRNRCCISALTNNSCGVFVIEVLLAIVVVPLAIVVLLSGRPISMMVTIARHPSPLFSCNTQAQLLEEAHLAPVQQQEPRCQRQVEPGNNEANSFDRDEKLHEKQDAQGHSFPQHEAQRQQEHNPEHGLCG